MPTEDGYPTTEELIEIKKLAEEVSGAGVARLVEFLETVWNHDGIKKKPKSLELHTLGWSGNEDIIGVLSQTAFWFVCWQKSERGGHFCFKYPKFIGGIEQ